MIDTLNYANQLEVLGIIQKGMESNKPQSATFQRLAFLVQKIILHNNSLEMALEDEIAQREYMLDIKNKQITELKTTRRELWNM
jgi:hypothetical protein|tara:strand:- start:4353 stop:4604 length:252 start_codon:yes stop_codon:yes gene_type:complete